LLTRPQLITVILSHRPTGGVLHSLPSRNRPSRRASSLQRRTLQIELQRDFTTGKIVNGSRRATFALDRLDVDLAETSKMNVGQAIRLCRTQRNASQTDVAQKANCSVSYLSMLENNKRDPTLSTLTRIAGALRVPIGVLFVLAAETKDLGTVDRKLASALARSALSSLGKSPGMTNAGKDHG
jgi:transcriptional regulator with XRE-family HTH domain